MVTAIPGIVDFGPVTTVEKVLAAKPGDPAPKFDGRVYNPSVEETYKMCVEKLDAEKSEKSE